MNDEARDHLCVNTLRFLAVDAVQSANSGHPGLPLGAAPMAYVLWTKFLRHHPRHPGFWDRDRFVLSAGHGSALLYALLHLTGYDLPLEELRRFRQWGSRTPGHPESELTPGVEATTGPLGQGISSAVGMAVAEAHLATRYNRPGHEIVNHRTYVLASDGDLMEGVSQEASSLAGHLALCRLVVLYDENRVTLAGSTSLTFTEDVDARYAALGWYVQRVEDGNDLGAIETCLRNAVRSQGRPSLIRVRTVIGYGSPNKQGTFAVHGSPLGVEEVARAKRALGWPPDAEFSVPQEARDHFRSAVARGEEWEREFRVRFDVYAREFPSLAQELRRRMQGGLPEDWARDLPEFPAGAEGLATRKASAKVLAQLGHSVPELVGGSGDLDPSTYTQLEGEGDFQAPSRSSEGAQGAAGGPWGYDGRNIHFGVREHAMGCIVNGLAYHGGFVPFGATFLAFSDYMLASIRLAALARLGSIFVFSHDSIGLGEDGPTHQPIAQLASLRSMPGLLVIRPCDANETRWAWQVAIEQRHRPTALVLTRQSVPTLDRSRLSSAEGLCRGAYVLNPNESADPDLILMATGSEVSLLVVAAELLRAQGLRARLVSMPCWRLFEEQSPEYRESVLPARVTARVAVEAASPLGWDRYAGPKGAIIALDRYGASAPGATVMQQLGFTPEHVARRALEIVTS